MQRGILGVLAGIVAGVAVTMLAEMIGHTIYPPPPGINVNDPEARKTLIASLPLGALIAVNLSWALGVFAGSTTAVLIGTRQSWPAWITAFVLFAFALATMTFIPHPDWMILAATLLTLASAIAAAYMWARS
jgi:hypothetical protein